MPKTNSKYQRIQLNPESIKKALDYVDQKWDNLERYEPDDKGTLIGLPYPYVVPSARTGSGFTFDEMYYWDSFFIAQALLKTGQEELASGMLENLMYMAKRFDIIPNGNRYYFTGRSQPPLLTSYILDVFEKTEDLSWLQESMTIAEYEYTKVWTASEQPNWRNVFHGLSRYYDINLIDGLAEAESGWDMTTRFGDHCLSYIPIDLNSLLYKYEKDFAYAAELLGDDASAVSWRTKAEERAETIHKYLWNEDREFYFDYNYSTGKHSEVWSLAAYYPLWAGLATQEQADQLVHHLEKFMQIGGLSTTVHNTKSNETEKFHHQWAYPNGWAPLHWIVVKGLERYGYSELAESIAKKWLQTNTAYFEKHGIFREAYNVMKPGEAPEAGLYPPQIGFGWSNAVFADFAIEFTDAGREWHETGTTKLPARKRILKKVKKILNKRISLS